MRKTSSSRQPRGLAVHRDRVHNRIQGSCPSAVEILLTTFCCGQEGKKAVHSIPREPLWQVLAGIGGVGPLVQCLSQAVQGTYADSMQTCMKTVLASLRKMAARSSAHAQQVSDRVAQPVLSCLAYILMHLWATW